jgi:hypothetical protein
MRIEGRVNQQLQALVGARVGCDQGQAVPVDLIVDTGCTHAIALSRSLVVQLRLRITDTVVRSDAPSGRQDFDTCDVYVECGGWRFSGRAVVTEVDGLDMLGMEAIAGHRLVVVVERDGAVLVEPLVAE